MPERRRETLGLEATSMLRVRDNVAVVLFLAAALSLARPCPAADDAGGLARHAKSLILDGRYAECYGWLREHHVEVRRDPLEHYLFAYAAYHTLQLAEVRAYARSASAGGAGAPYPGWRSAEDLVSGVERVAPMLPGGGWVRDAGGAALYRLYAPSGLALSDGLKAAGAASYAAASAVAFGDPARGREVGPLSLYVFATDVDAQRFLTGLGLDATTEGSAVTVGLGLLMWQSRDGVPTWSSPYRAEATLAHETLHAFESMLGLQYGSRWTIEGAALLAEDAVDPNHAILTRAAALDLVEKRPAALEEALDSDAADAFGTYPAYYALVETLAATYGLPRLGTAMRDLNRNRPGGLEACLNRCFSLDRQSLVAACRARMTGPSWGAAAELLRLQRAAAGPSSPEWTAAFRRWPSEPYFALLAARSAMDAGRRDEAVGIARALEAQGYVGARETTVAQLLKPPAGGGAR
jgi:hypothetical protein